MTKEIKLQIHSLGFASIREFSDEHDLEYWNVIQTLNGTRRNKKVHAICQKYGIELPQFNKERVAA